MVDGGAVHGTVDADGLAAGQDPFAANQVRQRQLPRMETVDTTYLFRL